MAKREKVQRAVPNPITLFCTVAIVPRLKYFARIVTRWTFVTRKKESYKVNLSKVWRYKFEPTEKLLWFPAICYRLRAPIFMRTAPLLRYWKGCIRRYFRSVLHTHTHTNAHAHHMLSLRKYNPPSNNAMLPWELWSNCGPIERPSHRISNRLLSTTPARPIPRLFLTSSPKRNNELVKSSLRSRTDEAGLIRLIDYSS